MEILSKSQIKHAILATDIAAFSIHEQKLRVLLLKAKSPLFTSLWALPGGLVAPEDSIDEAAGKYLDLFIKKGSQKAYLEQLYTFGDPKRDPTGRIVSVAYLALLPPKTTDLKTTKDYKQVSWFDIRHLPTLAYDHDGIIDTAIERLKAKLEYTNIIYSLMHAEFTLSELQKTYELILGRKLDKRNFRKKVHQLNLVKKTGRKKTGEPYRPAQLYKFYELQPKIIEVI